MDGLFGVGENASEKVLTTFQALAFDADREDRAKIFLVNGNIDRIYLGAVENDVGVLLISQINIGKEGGDLKIELTFQN